MRHPELTIHGTDKYPVHATGGPRNCQFRAGKFQDITNQMWNEPRDMYDLIHMRNMMMVVGTSDWTHIIDQAHR